MVIKIDHLLRSREWKIKNYLVSLTLLSKKRWEWYINQTEPKLYVITWCVDYILIRIFFKSHLQLHFYFELSEYGLLWSQQSVGASTPAPAPWETPLTHCGHSMLSVTSWWSTARHQSMATSETESTIVTGTCNHLFTAYRKFRYLDSKVWSVCKLQLSSLSLSPSPNRKS